MEIPHLTSGSDYLVRVFSLTCCIVVYCAVYIAGKTCAGACISDIVYCGLVVAEAYRNAALLIRRARSHAVGFKLVEGARREESGVKIDDYQDYRYSSHCDCDTPVHSPSLLPGDFISRSHR